MRRDGPGSWRLVVGEPGTSRPLDVDLQTLDAQLEAVGARARLSLRSRTEPTRLFTMRLRERLLAAYGEAPTRR